MSRANSHRKLIIGKVLDIERVLFTRKGWELDVLGEERDVIRTETRLKLTIDCNLSFALGTCDERPPGVGTVFAPKSILAEIERDLDRADELVGLWVEMVGTVEDAPYWEFDQFGISIRITRPTKASAFTDEEARVRYGQAVAKRKTTLESFLRKLRRKHGSPRKRCRTFPFCRAGTTQPYFSDYDLAEQDLRAVRAVLKAIAYL